MSPLDTAKAHTLMYLQYLSTSDSHSCHGSAYRSVARCFTFTALEPLPAPCHSVHIDVCSHHQGDGFSVAILVISPPASVVSLYSVICALTTSIYQASCQSARIPHRLESLPFVTASTLKSGKPSKLLPTPAGVLMTPSMIQTLNASQITLGTIWITLCFAGLSHTCVKAGLSSRQLCDR